MDGLPLSIPLQVTQVIQQTLKAPIDCVGIGLHSGRRAQLRLLPAPAGSGIVFRRTDLGVSIPARFDHVVDTKLCTVIGLPGNREARDWCHRGRIPGRENPDLWPCR